MILFFSFDKICNLKLHSLTLNILILMCRTYIYPPAPIILFPRSLPPDFYNRSVNKFDKDPPTNMSP